MTLQRWRLWRGPLLIELLVIVLVVYLFGHIALLDWDDQQLQQTGEHNESATLPILAEIGLRRYGEIPLWNPYMLTGFPHAGDLVNHFWNPVATLPVLIWGGINGMKVSVFLTLLIAACGQWFLAHTFGVRGVFRVWAGLLFALSGGLTLLWWLGWYELLLGVAWIPWAMAALWIALHREDRLSLALAALTIALVFTTGGGYYPLYLAVILGLVTAFALYQHQPGQRGRQLRRAAAVALLSLALAAVYFVPLTDGLRYTARDAPRDYPQYNSQRIAYALFNYVIADEAWLRTDVLGKASGSGWYYIGVLPLLALVFTPWYYGRFRWRRRTIILLLLLLVVLLAWHANRHTPVRYLYDLIPFLYTFRFPNRLLIVVTSPLLLLAALTLQALLVWSRGRVRQVKIDLAPRRGIASRLPVVSLVSLLNLLAVLVLVVTLRDVYRVNKPLATAPHLRNQEARETLTWLKHFDGGLYYVNIGGESIFWDWVAYAYELEVPVLNFRYNRRVSSMDAQFAPDSPFSAQPKYVIAGQDQSPPPGAELLTKIRGVNVWRRPDALPYAFVAADPEGVVNPASVREVAARLDGPNRVVIESADSEAGEQLVILVSDYPGWRLWIDDERAEIQSRNGYLGATMAAGTHTYVFDFRPLTHYLGLLISAGTLAGCAMWAGAEQLGRRRARREAITS